MTAFLKDVIGYGLHAARPAAGTAGALYYETDTDTLLRDNGSTWDALTLGSPSPLTTKGDVFVYGSSDARLPVGTNGQVLTADSAQALGVKWATPAAGGGSLSVLSNYLAADVTMTTANQFYDAASISCAAGTWLLIGCIYFSAVTTNGPWTVKLWDGTTVISTNEMVNVSGQGAPGVLIAGLGTPSSTTTYKISGASTGAGNKIRSAVSDNAAGNTATYLLGVKLA